MVDCRGFRRSRRHRFRSGAAGFLATILVSLAGDANSAPTAPTSEIVFSPAVVQLDNPTSPDGVKPPKSFALEVVAYDERGERIVPSPEHPLRIEISGARRGTITPSEARLTSDSSVTLTYDGRYIASPITLVAWIDSPAGERESIGRTLLLPANPTDCTHARDSYTLRVLCEGRGTPEECGLSAIRRGLKVRAAVGYGDPRGHLQPFGVDTGSIGTVVPTERLGPDAIGPGPPGSVY